MSAKVTVLNENQSISTNESAATPRLSKAQILSILPVRTHDLAPERPARSEMLRDGLKRTAERVDACAEELKWVAGSDYAHRIQDLKEIAVWLRAITEA